MPNRWDNIDKFTVAIKAAAWEARRIRHVRGTGSIPMTCVMQAAEKMQIVDEGKPAANVNQKIILEVIYVLAFVEDIDAFVDHEIDRAWLEYTGTGTKANAA